jgi:hypothetical protein
VVKPWGAAVRLPVVGIRSGLSDTVMALSSFVGLVGVPSRRDDLPGQWWPTANRLPSTVGVTSGPVMAAVGPDGRGPSCSGNGKLDMTS